MKQKFLAILENMRSIDLNKAPTYVVVKALAKHPKVTYPQPVLVASSIKIEVNEIFTSDPELLNTTVDTYVEMLNNIYALMVVDFGVKDGELVFLNMVKGMSLIYTYDS